MNKNLPGLRPFVLPLTCCSEYSLRVFVIFTSLKRLYLISCSFAVSYMGHARPPNFVQRDNFTTRGLLRAVHYSPQ